MLFKFNHDKKEIEMECDLCDNMFSQGSGLMFRKKSKPLLFRFKGAKKRAIHSFFCKKFYAIWFNRGQIVDEKLVSPWKISIVAKDRFDTLLEIPDNSEHFQKFVDGHRNI
jgi:uncharacterized membrane protein (UPF0127 family)